ncbi:MAG: hypothetical protein P4L92_19595 [Rudaea sp.]|nr:hypothetical protein [Rudaea sp.]
MENILNYQFNYGPQSAPVAMKPDPDAPIYASEDGRVASLSSQECIFLVKRTGEPHVMTFQVLQALDLCREFRTLDEHVARIQSTIPGLAGKREAVARVLDGLVQRKLLLSDADFIERLNHSPARVPVPMRAAFIRACDRPEQLGHLLASLADYERRYQANRRYVVIDDSVLAAHINEQRDLLREFARTTGCKVSYVGRAESAKIAEKFAKVNPRARDAVNVLLLREAHPQRQRFGGGRGRNLAILLSAGARLGLLDDDLRLPLRRPDFAEPGLDPNPNGLARASFYSSMEQALGGGSEVDEDPFELHLAACGQSLGALTAGPESSRLYGLSRDSLRGQNLGRLDLLSPGTHIVTTQHGTYGSSRTASALWLYQGLDPASRPEFWRDRESYLRNIEGHFLLAGVAKARLDEVPGFTPFTLDNSTMLPCTNPVGRAEDSLASALTRYCLPEGVALELPVAIGHVQETQRKRSADTLAASQPRVNDFLREFVRRQFGLFKAEDPGQRLTLLADVMRDLAHASSAERVEHLGEYLSYVRADIIDRLQHQIEAAEDAPVYWQADAREIVQANAKMLLASAPPRLADWPQDLDASGCASALSAELNTMADACAHWPTLWRHAADQGEKLLTAL